MSFTKSEIIANLLVRDIPSDFILAVQEGFEVASHQALDKVRGMHEGHIKNALGQQRHFEQNEFFYKALTAQNMAVSELKGNSIVIGKVGIWNICRATANDENWHSVKRSRSRQLLAQKNLFAENLVYGNLLEDNDKIASEGTVFFITSYSGSMNYHPERPVSIQIAVCDSQMEHWLFIENIEDFLMRYSIADKSVADPQIDLAKPTLKSKDKKHGTLE